MLFFIIVVHLITAFYLKIIAGAGADDFQCDANSDEHIPSSWKCDGEPDCSNGEDEIGCVSQCTATEWRCSSGLCIDDSLVCDGQNDCPDYSDENTTVCGNSASYCPQGMIKCSNSLQCIQIQKRCDGKNDCMDGDDEAHCQGEDKNIKISKFLGTHSGCDPVREFSCGGGECIDITWLCDGDADCQDESDENVHLCSIMRSTTIPTVSASLLPGKLCDDGIHYRCATGECINITLVCDTANHCPDASDELPVCETACLMNGGCGHKCNPTPTGPVCTCRPGYHLIADSKACQDVDECGHLPPRCSQHCINTPGSYECECEHGYTLQRNGHSCRVTDGKPEVLYVEGPEIRRLRIYDLTKHIAVIVDDGSGHISAFDYDVTTGDVFWYNSDSRTIHVLTQASDVKDLIRGMKRCDGLAVDWMGRNIYYIDGIKRVINVCMMNSTMSGNCFTAVQRLVDKPTSLVLDPSVGRMFWGDWGYSPCIETAYMTGRSRASIIVSDLVRPNALALDLAQRRLYWVDSRLRRIESCDYYGNDRMLVLESRLLHTYGLAVFEDFVFWSDIDSGAIYRSHKYPRPGGSDMTRLIPQVTSSGAVKIMHKVAQIQGFDNCGRKCSHLCLLAPSGVTCRCPNYMEPSLDDPNFCQVKDCLNGGTPVYQGINNIYCSCPVGFGGTKCDNKTGLMFTYPLLAKNNYAWVAGVLCVLVLSIASIVFGIYCCRRKRNTEKEIISIIKFRQSASAAVNTSLSESARCRSESTQILVEPSAFENPAYHQDEDENANHKGTLVVMSASDDSIDSAFLSRQDSVENDLSTQPLANAENYDSS